MLHYNTKVISLLLNQLHFKARLTSPYDDVRANKPCIDARTNVAPIALVDKGGKWMECTANVEIGLAYLMFGQFRETGHDLTGSNTGQSTYMPADEASPAC